MPSSFSPSLRLELIAPGEQAGTWGSTTNTNIGTLIESSVAGFQTVSVIAADQAMTIADGAADQSRSAMLRFTTTTGAAFNVYAPPVSKQYTVFNDSSHAATLFNSTSPGNTTAAGTGITIPAGRTLVVFTDGTNFRTVDVVGLSGVLAVTNGGTGATTAAGARTNLGTVNDPGSNGILVRTAANTTTPRSVAVSGTGLSVTNGDGVAGNPTVTSNATSANTNSTIVARDASGNFSAGTITATLSGNVTGNAATATALQTARTIGGVSFNGTADINLPGVNTAGNQNTTGTAANITGTAAVANGGTGRTTLTSNNVVLGAGTSAVNFVAPGTAGNVLTSNGTTWQSTAVPISSTAEAQAGTNNTNLMTALRTREAFNASGTAPVFACRAWVNFNGTNGNIRGSGNVSSVTRNGTGNYTINFTTAMQDANYSVTGPTINDFNTSGSYMVDSLTTTSFRARAFSAGFAFDPGIVCTGVFR
jgi:hypothetical protein